MKELIMKEMLKNPLKGNDQFNDDALEYIVDRINAILDVPLINEELERIIIQAIIRIIYNLLFVKNGMLNKI